MSMIRPLQNTDTPAVAGLYRTILERRPSPAPPALASYLDKLFLSGPAADPALPSLVMVDGERITGFMGSTRQDFTRDGVTLRGAIASALMVENHEADPLAGVRLMKTFLAGPQDVSLTETAGPPTIAIWKQLGGQIMPGHSFDWMRVVRPARFGVSYLARRFRPAGMLAPLADLVDRRAVKNSQPGHHLQWLGLSEQFRPTRTLDAQPLDAAEFPAFAMQFAASFAIRPTWSSALAETVGADLARKPQFGSLRAVALRTPAGASVGGFAYFLDRLKSARVVQVLARPNQEGLVLDSLLSDAAQRGAVVVEGRTTQQLIAPLAARRCSFFQRGISAVHSRSGELAQAFVDGSAMFNGLVGEYWTRLYGGSFDHDADDDPAPAPGRTSEKGEFVEAA